MSNMKVSKEEMLSLIEYWRSLTEDHPDPIEPDTEIDEVGERQLIVLDAIRATIERGRPTVNVAFIDKWLDRFEDDRNLGEAHAFYLFEEMLREARVRVKEPAKGD